MEARRRQVEIQPQGDETRQLVEQAREKEWRRPSFAAELFMGRLDFKTLLSFPSQSEQDRSEGDRFLARLESFLSAEVDGEAIDQTGEIPSRVLDGLARLGAFGMRIPREYGGLGLSMLNYDRAIALVSSFCSSTAVLLSAHQSIGVPQPLLLFGTPEQRRKYLPRLARGTLSAFALTEKGVGSDPARMTTSATLSEDGRYYRLNGSKLWCTNAPIADLFVVMAQTQQAKAGITALIVEKQMAGVEVVHRCRFMGLRGIQNGVLNFKDVLVPRENVLWAPGKGLHLALATLNAGRLSLPAAALGVGRECVEFSHQWAEERVQWGKPIAQHEAIAAKLSTMDADLFATEAVVDWVGAWVDSGQRDVRLESAMAKILGSERMLKVVEQAFQIRGGRGYETSSSLRARGEKPFPVERHLRDSRINTVIEGTSEILRLFIVREGLDRHLKIAGDLFKPGVGIGAKARILWRAGLFYLRWYPRQWLGRDAFRNFSEAGIFARHLRFMESASRRLARSTFHLMVKHGPALEFRQLLLMRLADIGTGLFAMAGVIGKARAEERAGALDRRQKAAADLFCRQMTLEIRGSFAALRLNTDAAQLRSWSRSSSRP